MPRLETGLSGGRRGQGNGRNP